MKTFYLEGKLPIDKLISRDEVEKLYVGGRLAEADVMQYTGQWIPLK